MILISCKIFEAGSCESAGLILGAHLLDSVERGGLGHRSVPGAHVFDGPGVSMERWDNDKNMDFEGCWRCCPVEFAPRKPVLMRSAVDSDDEEQPVASYSVSSARDERMEELTPQQAHWMRCFGLKCE